MTCWGDGSPLREFLYVDDLANLCVFLMNNYSGNETVNAGTGKELSIKELTELVAKVIGYDGEIRWDTSKPNGTPRKLLDVSKAAALGWTYKTELEEGIRLSYKDFLENPTRAERYIAMVVNENYLKSRVSIIGKYFGNILSSLRKKILDLFLIMKLGKGCSS